MTLPYSFGTSTYASQFKASNTVFSNGTNYYAVTVDTTNNTAEVWKSTDGGNTWAEQDSAHHPSVYNSAGWKVASGSVASNGTKIWVGYWTASSVLALKPFDMSTDTWGTASSTQNFYDYIGGAGTDRFIQTAVRTDGTVVVFAIYSYYFGSYVNPAYAIWNPSNSSWAVGVTNLTSTTSNAYPAGLGIDSANRCYFFYNKASTSIFCKTLNSSNTLNGTESTAVNAAATSVSTGTNPHIMTYGGTTYIYCLYIGSATGEPLCVTRSAVGDASALSFTNYTISATTTTNPEYANSNTGTLAVDSTQSKLYAYWSDDTTQHGYRDASTNGGATWGTDTNWLASGTLNQLNANFGNGNVLMLYNDAGTLKFTVLEAAISISAPVASTGLAAISPGVTTNLMFSPSAPAVSVAGKTPLVAVVSVPINPPPATVSVSAVSPLHFITIGFLGVAPSTGESSITGTSPVAVGVYRNFAWGSIEIGSSGLAEPAYLLSKGAAFTSRETLAVKHVTSRWLRHIPHIEVRTQDGALNRFIYDGYNIQYEHEVNKVGSMSFIMPADSPNASYITQGQLSELWVYGWDGDFIDAFVITKADSTRDGEAAAISVACAQVGTYLSRTQFPREYKVVSRTVYDILTDIMSMQDTVQSFIVDDYCNVPLGITFAQGDTIWQAIDSMRTHIGGYIRVECDPDHPNNRCLMLTQYTGQARGQEFHYRKNLLNTTRRSDLTTVVTRCYGIGAGNSTGKVRLSDDIVTDMEPIKYVDATWGYLKLSGDLDCYYGWSGDGDALPIDYILTDLSHIVVSGGNVIFPEYRTGDDGHVDAGSVTFVAQTFTATETGRLRAVDLKLALLHKYEFPTGTTSQQIHDIIGDTYLRLQVCLYETIIDYNNPSSGLPCPSPTGCIQTVEMSQSNISDEIDNNGNVVGAWYTFPMDSMTTLSAGTTYAIVIKNLPIQGTAIYDNVGWMADTSDPTYLDGACWASTNSGVNWTLNLDKDCLFSVRVAGDENTGWVQGADARIIKMPIAQYNITTDYVVRYRHEDYIVAWDLLDTWGIIDGHYENAQIEDAEALRLVTNVWLMENYGPTTTYDIGVVDLYDMDASYAFEKIELGSDFRLVDSTLGIAKTLNVTKVSKTVEDPSAVQVTVSTTYPSLTDSLFNLERKFFVGQRYRQGSESTYNFSLPADSTDNVPHTLIFKVPESATTVAAVSLDWYKTAYVSTDVTVDPTTGTNQDTTAGNNSSSGLNTYESNHTHVAFKLGASANVNTGIAAPPYVIQYVAEMKTAEDESTGMWIIDSTGVFQGEVITGGAGALHTHTPTVDAQVQDPHSHDQDSHDHSATSNPVQDTGTIPAIDVEVDGVAIYTSADGGILDIRKYMLLDVTGSPRPGLHTVLFKPTVGSLNPRAYINASVTVQVYTNGTYNI